MLANELIDRLERLGLLDQEIIEALREQLDQGGTRVTPEAVAKLLVDNGQLTRFQATKLIGELRSGQYDGDVPEAEVAEVDELGIVPEEGEIVDVEVMDAEPVEAVAEAVPVAVDAVPVEAVAVEAEPVAVEAVAVADSAPQPRPARPRPSDAPTVWDSFKVYGYLGIIAFLLGSGIILYFILNRQSADDVIEAANKLWDQQNYVNAQDQYVGYLDTFGEASQYASLANVRIALAELHRGLTMSDKTKALTLAQERLPTIEEEEALNDERGDLADLLVQISDSIATAAGKAQDTSEKEHLLSKLDESIELMQNPIYMTGSMRTTLSGRIKAVEEARARVRRDINRNKSLDATVASMGKSLDEENTKEAYDARYELLRSFPELGNNERLVELISRASEIQQRLVKSSSQMPEVAEGANEQDSLRSIVLTARNASNKVPSLRGEALYLRAQGSVWAFDGEQGSLKWRRFVGFGQGYTPVRLSGGEGVLLSDSQNFELQRCSGEDGKVRWSAKLEEDFSEPTVVRDEIFVCRKSGVVLALDVETGKANWATEIPQELEVSPGVDGRIGRAYLPGDHSNIYVMDSRRGTCIESFYLGHGKGTVAVPPVPLMGHVFVAENDSADGCTIHILKVNEKGEGLERAQDPIRMTGNVKVPPQISKQRRLVVLTDRGEVKVLDVELQAETSEKVRVLADRLSSYDRPTATKMVVDGNQLWITGTRIGNFDIQASQGAVVNGWAKYEGDTFVGQPAAMEGALLHARVLRGTTGIRVTAADPKTGDPYWTSDIGVPISLLTKAPNGFHAVTSQAALFELDRQSLTTGATQNFIENPGGAGVALRFEDPIVIDETKRVMLNHETPGQTILYDPSRPTEKLRLVTLNYGTGAPSGNGVISGGGLFLTITTGRAVLLNWQTGLPVGSPLQPPSDPTKAVQWTNSIPIPNEDDLIIVGDSRKKLYKVRVGEQIRDVASKDLAFAPLGHAAAVGETWFAAAAGPSADILIGHDMAGLNEKFQKQLNGRVAWGPMSVGDVCLIQTEDQKLYGFDQSGQEKFSVQLPLGKPVGNPILVGDKIVLAGRLGWLVSIDSAAGQLAGTSDLGQPISATPLPAGNNLLVPGAEGVVYISSIPGQ